MIFTDENGKIYEIPEEKYSEFKVSDARAREILQQELDNITKEKEELILQAEQSLLQDSSCENKLSIINNTQMEYLNEWESYFIKNKPRENKQTK